MAYTLDQVREWNASLKATHSELVALFVGGTSGIGKHTALRMASSIYRPCIYIIGRNEAAGAQVVKELKATNAEGSYAFIPTDVSELRNVDAVCQELNAHFQVLDLLFMSTGSLALRKQETETGIDVNHMLRYYSRMRFVYNLLPLLESAASPRVVSVLAGGKEVDVQENNLDLRKKFTLSASFGYPVTMTSLVFELLASQNASISFVHVFPGMVATPLMKTSMGGFLGSVMSFLTKPMSILPEESGEWKTFISTSPYFPAKVAGQDLPADQKTKLARASTGEPGGGSYIVKHNGQDATNQRLMSQFRERGLSDTIWKHTLEIFDQAVPPTKPSESQT